MTTKRKGPSRRLMLTATDRNKIGTQSGVLSAELSFAEWATGGDEPRMLAAELARGHYLRALAKLKPTILRDLRVIKVGDDQRLQAWAQRYRLPSHRESWALRWAQQTIRLSGARYWCPPVGEVTGVWLADAEPKPRSRTKQEIAHLAPLVHHLAFAWLARFQMGDLYDHIARWDGSTASNVRRECAKLAALIDLSLRPVSPGRQPKKRRATPTE